jgi:hypothetical protein
MTKEEALDFVLKVLGSKMALASKTTKEKAIQAAKEHNISAVELIERLENIIWKI